MNNDNVQHHSHHYLIGMKLNKDFASELKGIQQDIFVKNNYLDETDKLKNMYIPFIYLGYFNESIEKELKQKLMPLFFAVAEKFNPIKCYLKNYILGGQSKNFKYLALHFDNKDDCLENIIIPYIKDYLNKNLDMKLIFEDKPIIPLFRLRGKDLKQFLEKNQYVTDNKIVSFPSLPFPSKLKYNKEQQAKFFMIDSIEILSATPTKIKKGHKSFNEQLRIESIVSIPLAGKMKC